METRLETLKGKVILDADDIKRAIEYWIQDEESDIDISGDIDLSTLEITSIKTQNGTDFSKAVVNFEVDPS